MTKIKDIKATGEYIVCRAVEIVAPTEVTTQEGIILPGQKGPETGNVVNKAGGEKGVVDLIVDSIGPLVNAEELGFKEGDVVIINNYDAQALEDTEGKMYILCLGKSVKAVISYEEE